MVGTDGKGSRIVLVGNGEDIHVGAHLRRAAETAGLDYRFCDVSEAFSGSMLKKKWNWWVRGKRPSGLASFSMKTAKLCDEFRPNLLLTTGLAPLNHFALEKIGTMGIRRVNYLTDDPWNSSHRSPWFMKALPVYDAVFSCRMANLNELEQLGCREVSYLPFAFCPAVHFPEEPDASDATAPAADVLFAGGADEDRVPYVSALIEEGINVALYGGYWDRFSATRATSRGHATLETLRKAVGAAKIALCLVRRANRDDHAMRSFELPAMKACLLAEDTAEHREIFGADGVAALYFRNVSEMLDRTKWLLARDSERARLREAAYSLITSGGNTYKDRLLTMMGTPTGRNHESI